MWYGTTTCLDCNVEHSRNGLTKASHQRSAKHIAALRERGQNGLADWLQKRANIAHANRLRAHAAKIRRQRGAE